MKIAGYTKYIGLIGVILCTGLIWQDTVDAEGLERKEQPQFVAQAVREVTIEDEGETILEIAYNPRENKSSYAYWDMRVPYESAVTVDTEAMYAMFEALASIDFTDEALADVKSITPDAQIQVKYYADQKAGEPGAADPTAELSLLIERAEDGYLGYLEGYEERVVQLDQTLIDSVLGADPYNMILKITHLVNIEFLSGFTAQSGEKTLALQRDGDGLLTVNGKEVGEEEFNGLYMKFMSVLIEAEIPEDAKISKDRTPLLTLTYQYLGEKAEDLTVEYYVYDDTYCSVSADGKEFFLVSREELEKLTEEVLALP